MAVIVTRAGKGAPLTNNEVDSNFTNLNTELDDVNTALGTKQDNLPSQSGNAGKYLKTDGSVLAWESAGAIESIFYENSQTVTSNYTIGATTNAVSAGPITIADGVTVTVNDGGAWSIV
jgi:hypothetical protein